jgi:iron complex outermembrane receptor protein
MNTAARSYHNVQATMSGLEMAGAWSVTDRLIVSGDVSAVRGRKAVDAAAGVNSPYLSEMPPARGRLAVRYETKTTRWGGFAEIESIYALAQTAVDTDLRESPTPPYALTNARLGATFGRLRAAVGLANIFNRTYYENLSYQRDPFRNGTRVFEPGRNVYANVTVAVGQVR